MGVNVAGVHAACGHVAGVHAACGHVAGVHAAGVRAACGHVAGVRGAAKAGNLSCEAPVREDSISTVISEADVGGLPY